VDQLESEPYLSYAAARQDVRESQGAERIRTWVQYRLQEPRFDNPDAQMPNPGLTAEEAAEIADLLLAQPGGWERAKETLRDFLPSLLNWRHLLYAFLGGAAAMLLLAGGLKLAGLVRVSVVFGRRGEPTDHTPGEG
jgi:hypothetical protein